MPDSQLQLFNGTSPFDAIRKLDDLGVEFWTARELMPLLGYSEWRYFEPVVARAKLACQNTGNLIAEHFSGGTNKNSNEYVTGRPQVDYVLTRLASYLVAMNGDPRKVEIAMAQSYFAAKTREAETRQPQESEDILKLKLAIELEEKRKQTEETAIRHTQLKLELAKAEKQLSSARQPKAAKPEPAIDTKLMIKVLDYAKVEGKVFDRTLVSKRWVKTAKDARKLMQKMAELGHGRINHEARVSISLVPAT